MTNNHHEDSLKAAKRAEIERLWFAEEATNEDLLQAYKALDVDPYGLESVTDDDYDEEGNLKY